MPEKQQPGKASKAQKIRHCPVCGEKISEVAVKCQFCKSDLTKKSKTKKMVSNSGKSIERNCPFCGKKILETDETCIHCKTDLREYFGKQSRMSARTVISLAAVLILAIVLIGFFSKGSFKFSHTNNSVFPEISADIQLQDGHLIINNKNPYTWTPLNTTTTSGITFTINDDYIYVYPGDVSPNEPLDLDFSSFKRKNGSTLNLQIDILRTLKINCNEKSGTISLKNLQQ